MIRAFLSTIIVVLVSGAALPVLAQPFQSELVLLPIILEPGEVVPGGQGSQWTGELWLHNPNRVAFLLQGPCEVQPCPSIFASHLDRVTGINRHSVDSGALIEVPSDLENPLHLSNRIFEEAGDAQPLGVEIPVVRENEFVSEPIEFLGIPIDPLNRVTLRVYDPRRMVGSTVLVEILSPNGEVVASTALAPGDFEPMANNRWYPGYAALFDLVGTFPQLASYETVHLRVTPLTEGMEYWTFLSITDNATQHVALYTPQ